MNVFMDSEADKVEIEMQLEEDKRKSQEKFLNPSEFAEELSVHIKYKIENSEDLMKICGDGGAWQIFIFLLGASCGFNCAIQNLIYLFIAEVPPYHCSLPEVDETVYSVEQLKRMLIPKNKDTGDWEQCLRYKHEISSDGLISHVFNTTESCNTEAIPIYFDEHHLHETVGTEWTLVCKDAFWIPSVESFYLFGNLVGAIVFGILSDKYGRRQAIWTATFIFLICTPLVGLSTNFVVLLVFRFLVGFASPGVYSVTYVLVVESIGRARRGLAGSLYSIPYSIGYMVIPTIAYFIREWRILQMASALMAPLLVLTWWYLPESPRWLLLQGRATEAEQVYRRIAQVNGHELPDNFHELVKKVARSEKKTVAKKPFNERFRRHFAAVCLLLRTPKLRFRVLSIAVAFFSIGTIYYGIAISPTKFGFDAYLFTFLCGLLEIPSEIAVAISIDKSGRRLVFSGYFFLCGTMLMVSLLLPKGSVIDLMLFLSAQLFISGNSTLIYLYAAELFPTEIRSYCIGFCSMLGKSGAIAVPYLVDRPGDDDKNLPTIIFGAFSLISGALALLLPETRNKKLPETVKEIEQGKAPCC